MRKEKIKNAVVYTTAFLQPVEEACFLYGSLAETAWHLSFYFPTSKIFKA
ncbi:hypothetical protein [Bacillus sp. PK3_68]|nr:hypothetical protein [Bacillus sp. PK3_68]